MLKAHPEFAHHFIMSILFGIMALSTLRCKFLWLPHSSILAAAGLTHTSMWTSIQEKLGISRVTVRATSTYCLHLPMLCISAVFQTQGLKYVMIAGLVTAIITLVSIDPLSLLNEFCSIFVCPAFACNAGRTRRPSRISRPAHSRAHALDTVNTDGLWLYASCTGQSVCRADTHPVASFAGTMQLMASVKLCTNRPICNHPHYEDKWLRRRTRQVRTSNI